MTQTAAAAAAEVLPVVESEIVRLQRTAEASLQWCNPQLAFDLPLTCC